MSGFKQFTTAEDRKAEQATAARKQAAYEAKRKAHTEGWFKPEAGPQRPTDAKADPSTPAPEAKP